MSINCRNILEENQFIVYIKYKNFFKIIYLFISRTYEIEIYQPQFSRNNSKLYSIDTLLTPKL